MIQFEDLLSTYLVLAGLAAWIGWRQHLNGGGSIKRLLAAATFAAFWGLAPLTVWFGMQTAGLTPDWDLACGAAGLSVGWMMLTLRPPLGLRLTSAEIPGDETAESVAALSRALRIKPPTIRVLRTVGGSLRSLAWVGGLPAPSLVLTDGIFYRLPSTERDAVIAHELAHIANGSLWMLSLALPLCCAVAIAVSTEYSVGFAAAFGYAFYAGFKPLLSRFIEADCDRRAARVTGFRQMVSALAKIHALHPVPNTGLLSLLAYAAATHPSRSMRLALLCRAAPPEDVPEHQIEPGTFWRHRLASIAAFLIWIATIVIALRHAWQIKDPDGMVSLLIAVGSTPAILLLLALRPKLGRDLRRLNTRPRGWLRLLRNVLIGIGVVIVAMIVSVAGAIFSVEASPKTFQWTAMAVGLLTVIVVGWLSRRFWPMVRARRRILTALFQHDFAKALESGADLPPRMARRPRWRYLLAAAAWANGDRQRAIADLEQLCHDAPHFKAAAMDLSAMYADEGQPTRALELALQLASALKKDPLSWVLLAHAYERLDQLGDAQQAVQEALRLDPNDGSSWAMAALVAGRQGNLEAAQSSIAKAAEHAPGEPRVLAIQAKLAVATHGATASRALIEAALAAIAANPFSIMNTEIAELRAYLAAASQPAEAPTQIESA